jgi:hypothetical protein
MEYSSDDLAQAAYVTNGFISNSDIDDEDMADITDWTDTDGTGASTQATFDSKSCLKLLSNATPGGGTHAQRTRDIGTFGTRAVISLSVYFDAIGTEAQADFFELDIFNGSNRFLGYFCSDGLKIHNGTVVVEAGTNIVVQDTWQEYTFDINWTAKTVDVYLDGVLKASGMSINMASATANGTINLLQAGITTGSRVSYVDWIKAGDIFALQSYPESTIKTQGSYSLKAVAAATDSLNKTLTRTISSPLNLSGVNTLSFDIRSSRTGSNIKIGLHDSGGTTTEITPNILSADTFQTVSVDLSAVSDANKDAIDSIIITPINADAENIFYIDNFIIAQAQNIFGIVG